MCYYCHMYPIFLYDIVMGKLTGKIGVRVRGQTGHLHYPGFQINIISIIFIELQGNVINFKGLTTYHFRCLYSTVKIGHCQDIKTNC